MPIKTLLLEISMLDFIKVSKEGIKHKMCESNSLILALSKCKGSRIAFK